MTDINELRWKANSTNIVDHIDLHTNIRPIISELLDRLEAAEKDRSNFIVEMGKLCAQCDALRAKIAEMEKQEPVALVKWQVGGQVVHIVGDVKPGDILYALPGAKGE